jgi:GNAT superfamily N-acetyltransferase
MKKIMKKYNYIIRKVEPKDARQYVELHNYVWRKAYKNIFPNEVFEDRETRTEEKISGFAENYFNDNNQICYVAESDGKIVGFMFGTIKATYPYFEKKGFADLVALYIHPDFQHIGIGTKFKEIFTSWAKENGAKKFVIGVLKDNKPARKAYESWGGKLDDHTQPFVKLGVGYDEVFYTYEI